MKNRSSFFLRLPVLAVSLLLCGAGTALFRAHRMVWVFFDPNLRFLGGARGLFALELAVIAVLLVLLTLRLFARERGESAKFQNKACAAIEDKTLPW